MTTDQIWLGVGFLGQAFFSARFSFSERPFFLSFGRWGTLAGMDVLLV